MLDDEMLVSISRACTRLRVLDISCCPLLTGAGVREAGRSLYNLNMFNIDTINSLIAEDLVSLLGNNRRLHTFSIRRCHALTGLGILTVGDLAATGVNSVRPFGWDQPSASSSHSPSSSLDLNATSPSVVPFAQLESCHLSGCHALTDLSLEPIRLAAGLRVCCLSYCHLLTDASLALLVGLTRLEHLDVSYLPKVTDTGLCYIANLRRLRSLALSHCRKITTHGAITLMSQLRLLVEVRMAHTKVSVDDLLRHFRLFDSSAAHSDGSAVPSAASTSVLPASAPAEATSGKMLTVKCVSRDGDGIGMGGVEAAGNSATESRDGATIPPSLNLIDIRGCKSAANQAEWMVVGFRQPAPALFVRAPLFV
mmetsp:Transcript_73674/g.209927  ORF Transcript_73674/g.209927 Transcript_73674/m.209927 type:complete len:367 (-) Transcript_73674:152-1252(-)